MKAKLVAVSLLAAALSAMTASAHVDVTVACPNGNTASGIHVCATLSTDNTVFVCGDTDSTGFVRLTVPDVNNATYHVCVDTTTLPAGATLSVPCQDVTFNGNAEIPATFTLGGTFCTTPCPECVDPALGLGAATGMSVLELGAAQVSINGPAGGIIGNVAIAAGGKANFSGGGEFVTGDILLGPGATYQNSGLLIGGSVLRNQDLSAQIAAAYAANSSDAALPCNQTFTTLDGKSVTTIHGVSGINVICVKDISLQGKQILLTGPSDAKFIFNITGKFVLNGGGQGPQIRVDTGAGLLPSAVLYNLVGTGEDVAFNGGGGGVNCCAAIVDGTILAPHRKIALAPGLVHGEVISGLDISIVSGASVRCPPCP